MKKFLFFFLTPLIASAAVKTELLPYKKDSLIMDGYVAFDAAQTGPRPGVVIFADKMGKGKFTERKARELAALGYVVLAADLYGQNNRPRTTKEGNEASDKFISDRKLMRARALASMEALARDRRVNTRMIAAIGYGFGGNVALELAREGAPLRGAVSFHGNLESSSDIHNFFAKILILHGANDPLVSKSEVAEFQKEMTDIKADWQMIYYSNAGHSFTDPDVGNDPKSGIAYNRSADERSWRALKDFLEEVFHK